MQNICHACGKEIQLTSFSDGCGIDKEGHKICYVCCGKLDTEYIEQYDKFILYLVRRGLDWFVTNWPSSLEIKVNTPRKGKHNFAGVRYDVWFRYAGKYWHGVTYGNMTQACHCKVIKG